MEKRCISSRILVQYGTLTSPPLSTAEPRFFSSISTTLFFRLFTPQKKSKIFLIRVHKNTHETPFIGKQKGTMDTNMANLASALQGGGIESDITALGAGGGGAFPSAEPTLHGEVVEGGGSSDDGMDQTKTKSKKKKKTGGFQSFNLHRELYKGVQGMKFVVPTPIQRKAIPVLLEGNDVVAMARTGSGKTAAYLIPMIQKIRSHSQTVGARGMVLSPTRELAIQILRVAKQLSRHTDIRYCVIVGGLAISEQFTDLAGNPDVLIGSPGRLLHIVMEADIKLKRVETVVLDEADRLFETGSLGTQVGDLLRRLPDTRQVSLFSATLPAGLAEFANAGLHNPKVIRLDSEMKISDKLQLSYFMVRREEKLACLLFIIRELIKVHETKSSTLVFVPTKHHGEFLRLVFEYFGLSHSSIHGGMDQENKQNELQRFSERKTHLLIVTDLAARGIDIPLLDNVINFEFPDRPKLFVHRVGRAARAGRSGKAYSIITRDELPHVIDLHLFLGFPLKNTVKDIEDKKDASDDEEDEEEEEEEMDEEEEQKRQARKMKARAGQADPEDGFFGVIPPYLLDEDANSLQLVLSESPEVYNQHKTSTNAFKLYSKTRKGAAPESIKKAKLICTEGVETHPVFLQAQYNTKAVVAKTDILKTISGFRPAANIFEAQTHGTKVLFKSSRAQTEQTSAVPKEKKMSNMPLSMRLLSSMGGQQSAQPKRNISKIAKPDEKEHDAFYIPYVKPANTDEAGYSVNELKDAVLDVTADSKEDMVRQRQVHLSHPPFLRPYMQKKTHQIANNT